MGYRTRAQAAVPCRVLVHLLMGFELSNSWGESRSPCTGARTEIRVFGNEVWMTLHPCAEGGGLSWCPRWAPCLSADIPSLAGPSLPSPFRAVKWYGNCPCVWKAETQMLLLLWNQFVDGKRSVWLHVVTRAGNSAWLFPATSTEALDESAAKWLLKCLVREGSGSCEI